MLIFITIICDKKYVEIKLFTLQLSLFRDNNLEILLQQLRVARVFRDVLTDFDEKRSIRSSKSSRFSWHRNASEEKSLPDSEASYMVSANCSYTNMGMLLQEKQDFSSRTGSSTKTRSVENVSARSSNGTNGWSKQPSIVKQISLPKPPSTGYFSEEEADLSQPKTTCT